MCFAPYLCGFVRTFRYLFPTFGSLSSGWEFLCIHKSWSLMGCHGLFFDVPHGMSHVCTRIPHVGVGSSMAAQTVSLRAWFLAGFQLLSLVVAPACGPMQLWAPLSVVMSFGSSGLASPHHTIPETKKGGLFWEPLHTSECFCLP